MCSLELCHLHGTTPAQLPRSLTALKLGLREGEELPSCGVRTLCRAFVLHTLVQAAPTRCKAPCLQANSPPAHCNPSLPSSIHSWGR